MEVRVTVRQGSAESVASRIKSQLESYGKKVIVKKT